MIWCGCLRSNWCTRGSTTVRYRPVTIQQPLNLLLMDVCLLLAVCCVAAIRPVQLAHNQGLHSVQFQSSNSNHVSSYQERCKIVTHILTSFFPTLSRILMLRLESLSNVECIQHLYLKFSVYFAKRLAKLNGHNCKVHLTEWHA